MTSQPGKQTTAIFILPNISRSKSNQTMKSGQLIECNQRQGFPKESWRKLGRETSSGPIFTFWKGFIWGKSKWSAALFQYISIALNLTHNKNKLHKSLGYWSRDILNFGILETRQVIVSPPHFVYDFSRKNVFRVYSTNWPSFIVWLPLLLEILGSKCIAIFCFPGCDLILKLTLFLWSSHFSAWPKSQNKKLNFWEPKELLMWSKTHFSHFRRAFICHKILSDLRLCL